MTPTETQILALLERKKHIDDVDIGTIDLESLIEAKGLWWLIEAVELLLRHQLELRNELRKEAIEQLNKDLCKEITKEVMATLREDMRNAGILR